MAFDDKNRNLLQKMVDSCRRLLSAEFIKQLQELYGIQPGTGSVIDLSEMTHLTADQYSIASLLRDRIDHLAKQPAYPPSIPPLPRGGSGGCHR
jgi:hypothetical protein